MKSREEFEKSVFAKRDALLKKRKNAIITAVSLGCTALCLTVAASAIKPMKTADTGGSGETEIYYNGALPHDETIEDLLRAEDDAKENEKTTFVVDAEGIVEETFSKCGGEDAFPQKQFGYSPGKTEIEEETAEAFTMTEIYRDTVASTKKSNALAGPVLAPEIGGEPATEIVTEPYFVEGKQQSSAASMPEKKYPSNEEIIAAALSYLTDSEKASIIDDTPSIAMTHYTDKAKGDEYTLYFRTLTGKIKVVLLVDTLELVEKK